jgi:hypothetical protein
MLLVKYTHLLTITAEVLKIKMIIKEGDKLLVIDKFGNEHRKGWLIPTYVAYQCNYSGHAVKLVNHLQGHNSINLYKRWVQKHEILEI